MWSHRLCTFIVGLVALVFPDPVAAARAPVPFEGDFTVPAEEKELEAFCRRHNAVSGDLIVDRSYGHADLTPISCVHAVGGRLVIRNTSRLERLSGLTLDRMEGVPLKALRLVNNAALVEVGDLLAAEPTTRVANLVVEGNPRLEVLRGLPPVVSGAGVTIVDNSGLTRVEGPSGARRSTRLRAVVLANNAHLASVGGFDGVVEVERISVEGNPLQRSLEGLDDLQLVEQWSMVNLPRLVSWRAGTSVTAIGALEVRQCDALPRLPGFSALNRASSVHIVDNASLSSVSGLSISRTAHPTVDELVVEGNRALSSQEAAALMERLHLPVSREAVRVRGNAPAEASPSEASGEGPPALQGGVGSGVGADDG